MLESSGHVGFAWQPTHPSINGDMLASFLALSPWTSQATKLRADTLAFDNPTPFPKPFGRSYPHTTQHHPAPRPAPSNTMNDEDQLHQTALEVIRALKRLSDYSNLRIVVIGGLARMRYSPRSRHTKVSSTPSLVS
jgi:hypothetical protein